MSRKSGHFERANSPIHFVMHFWTRVTATPRRGLHLARQHASHEALPGSSTSRDATALFRGLVEFLAAFTCHCFGRPRIPTAGHEIR